MKRPFWKMHGAGNDFIVMDDRRGWFPGADTTLIRRLCDRHDGIGSEGLLLIRSSRRADFRMQFFNPDGTEAGMCGNGARCIARLAHDLGAAPRRMRIETAAGELAAEIMPDGVRLRLPPPVNCRCNQILAVEGRAIRYHTINTGVPHVVVEAKDLDREDVFANGIAIRRHAAFAPEGANVDFMAIVGPQALRIRTFERGVEAETPACGTGITAGALIAGRLGLVTPPVRVTCAHGDTLEVGFRLTDDGYQDVTLLGPAAYVFQGSLEIRFLPSAAS